MTWTMRFIRHRRASSLATARSVKRKIVAAARVGLGPDPPAMRLDDGARDREADAHALRAWW